MCSHGCGTALTKGDRVKFVNHHIKELNGREAIVLERVQNTYYSWRVWVPRPVPVMCGPVIPISDRFERCTVCGWKVAREPKVPRENHHWFDPTDFHSFILEVNEALLKKE